MKGLRRSRRSRIPGEELVIAELRRRAPRRGMRKQLAHELGTSEPTLAGIATGNRGVSPRIAEGLGFRLVARWERVEDPGPG